MMTPEELLTPRFKHIASYPISKMYFDIGQILIWNYAEQSYQCSGKDSRISMAKDTIESFPHLFKKLEWWEERKEDELPKYVSHIAGGSEKWKQVFKLINPFPNTWHDFNPFGQNNITVLKNENRRRWIYISNISKKEDGRIKYSIVEINSLRHFLPATEEEFNSQNK